MATILVTWELGGGLGHVAGLKPIVEELARRGHRVALALRNLAAAKILAPEHPIDFWQAPIHTLNQRPANPLSYHQLLANVGFNNYDGLAFTIRAWRSIYAAVRPDLVLFEHSPTALLAARGADFRRVVIGSGFVCPPTEPDLPDLGRKQAGNSEQIAADIAAEAAARGIALQNAQRALESSGSASIRSLADLYREVDATILCAFEELDHFGPRTDCRYWGCYPSSFGRSFDWPDGSGQKIFAYLKPFKTLPVLLNQLSAWGFPTIVYMDPLDRGLERRFASRNLMFSRQPIDVRQAARQCDLAILNGGHGAQSAMLLAGKPSLILPLYWEQLMLGRRARRSGIAEIANPADESAVENSLRTVLDSPRYAEVAATRAERYASFDATQVMLEATSHLEEICAGRKP